MHISIFLTTVAYISLWNLTVHRWKWSEATCMADFMGYQYSFCWWNYNDSWRWYGLDASSQDCTNTGTYIANCCCINFIYLFIYLFVCLFVCTLSFWLYNHCIVFKLIARICFPSCIQVCYKLKLDFKNVWVIMITSKILSSLSSLKMYRTYARMIYTTHSQSAPCAHHAHLFPWLWRING